MYVGKKQRGGSILSRNGLNNGALYAFRSSNPALNSESTFTSGSVNPPGRDGAPVGSRVWEPTGIIDTGALFGPNTWLVNVQAHPPAPALAPNTVEDGQLLLMTPKDSARGCVNGPTFTLRRFRASP